MAFRNDAEREAVQAEVTANAAAIGLTEAQYLDMELQIIRTVLREKLAELEAEAERATAEQAAA